MHRGQDSKISKAAPPPALENTYALSTDATHLARANNHSHPCLIFNRPCFLVIQSKKLCTYQYSLISLIPSTLSAELGATAHLFAGLLRDTRSGDIHRRLPPQANLGPQSSAFMPPPPPLQVHRRPSDESLRSGISGKSSHGGKSG